MKVVNDIPPVLRAALEVQEYRKKPDAYSVTELTQPPLISALKRMYPKARRIAEDSLFAFMGKGIHLALEDALENNPDLQGHEIIALEGYVQTQVGRHIVAGRFDCMERAPDGKVWLWDWKTAKTGMMAKLAKEGDKPEWRQQLECYAAMIDAIGGTVPDKLAVGVMFKDYSKVMLDMRDSYPPKGMAWLEWDYDRNRTKEVVAWMEGRIRLIEENIEALKAGKEPPHLCTPEEMWEEPPFALMKEGRKTAVKRFQVEEDAVKAMMAYGKGHYVMRRPTLRLRCKYYCDAADVCPVYQSAQHEGADKEFRIAQYE